MDVTRPSSKEGAGNAGCRLHPWSACRKKCTRQNHRFSRYNRHSLRNGFNGLYVVSPVRPGFVVTVISVMRSIIAKSAPASGRRDHTTSPSAIRHSSRDDRVHRIPLPTSVTIAKRPSCGSETRGSIVVICPTAQEEMCTTGNLRMARMRRLLMGPCVSRNDGQSCGPVSRPGTSESLRDDGVDCFSRSLLPQRPRSSLMRFP
jgi:hypothetical protein